MRLEEFIQKLEELKPNIDDLVNSGYSLEFAKTTTERLDIKLKKGSLNNISNSKIVDLLTKYELSLFSINNVTFSDVLRKINGLLVIANIEGGYLMLDEESYEIFVVYADDIENRDTLICDNEESFLKILLIAFDYDSKVYKKEVLGIDNKVREDFIKKCELISPFGFFEPLF